MPAGDRTGPNGEGPMTGRRMGYCSDSDVNDGRFGSFGFGRGRGQGRGFRSGGGRGMGRFFGFSRGNDINVEESDFLEREIDFLKSKLKGMESYLEKLKNRK